MAFLTNIICLVVLLNNVPRSIGLIEGNRGASWSIGGDVGIEPGKVIGEVAGDVEKDIEAVAQRAEDIGGDIVNAAGEFVENVGEGVQHIAGDIGEGIEGGVEGIIDGAKGAIDGIGGIVGKLTPTKHHKKDSSQEKNHGKKNKHHGKSDESNEDSSSEEGSHEKHHKKHSKESSSSEEGSHERHHKKHDKEDSREKHGSHEKHHERKDDKRGHKHHDRHTGRGIDGRTGIGSHDGIRTPILDLLGLTKSVCTISYAAEGMIQDLGELHIWADKQMGIIEHAAVNYVIDNVVLKAVDGARKYHNKVVNFVIDTHIGIQRLVTNSIIEAYRVTKAPIRELFACH